MKILTINRDKCNLCGERLDGERPRTWWLEARIERRRWPTLRYCIPFHTACWNQASGSSVHGDLTYRKWIDLTGTEWDVDGLVKFCGKGKIIDYHYESRRISDHEAEKLINS